MQHLLAYVAMLLSLSSLTYVNRGALALSLALLVPWAT